MLQEGGKILSLTPDPFTSVVPSHFQLSQVTVTKTLLPPRSYDTQWRLWHTTAER